MAMFERQIGEQSGIQLNPTVDRTDGVAGFGDQTAAIVGSFSRGRIDKPFWVDGQTLRAKLGAAVSLNKSLLNEAYLHVFEALRNGAQQVLVSRLLRESVTNDYVVIQIDAAAGALQTETGEPILDGAGNPITMGNTGIITTAASIASGFADELAIAFKLKDGINEGFVVRANFDAYDDVDAWNDLHTVFNPKSLRITIEILDKASLQVLYRAIGAVHPDSVDEFGQTRYIGDLASDVFVFYAGNLPNASYQEALEDSTLGVMADGTRLFIRKSVDPFNHINTAYTNTELDVACDALRYTNEDFGYIMGGGTQSVPLLTRLIDLSYHTETLLAIDVPSDKNEEDAITWVNALNVDNFLISCYWTPLKCDEPINGGKQSWGSSGAQIGLRCNRNARVNSIGFAPKNNPIAGKNWPLPRTGITQLRTPTANQLSNLAKAKINPVILDKFSDGSRYTFRDSLTMARTLISKRKLITTAEMSAHMNQIAVRIVKDYLQQGMTVAIARSRAQIERLCQNAEASGWLVPSRDPQFLGLTYTLELKPNDARPNDWMDVRFYVSFDGVARVAIIEQTII
jgi:hypothetical protein